MLVLTGKESGVAYIYFKFQCYSYNFFVAFMGKLKLELETMINLLVYKYRRGGGEHQDPDLLYRLSFMLAAFSM